jgi:hypothetical protein
LAEGARMVRGGFCSHSCQLAYIPDITPAQAAAINAADERAYREPLSYTEEPFGEQLAVGFAMMAGLDPRDEDERVA